MDTVISPVKIEVRRKIGVRSGDTVRVHQKVIERGKTRTQVFEGLVIAVKHGTEAGGSFTVRATLSGIGVEKIFPLYTPLIEKIEIVKRSKVRRAKLYFIREKAAKAVRRQLRNARMMNLSTEDIAEEDAAEEAIDAEAKDASEEVSEETSEEATEASSEKEVSAEEKATEEAPIASVEEPKEKEKEKETESKKEDLDTEPDKETQKEKETEKK